MIETNADVALTTAVNESLKSGSIAVWSQPIIPDISPVYLASVRRFATNDPRIWRCRL